VSRLGWLLLAEIILTAGLLVGALWVFRAEAARIPIQGDESRYLWRARYFDYLFVQHDLGRAEWGDNHWTHTQPMLANYLVGGWLWLRGYNLDGLMADYDWSKSWGTNNREGRAPGPTVLQEARTPMILLATSVIALLYLLGRALGGPIAGFTAALLALGSPLARENLVQVRSEAPFAAFLLLSLLLAVLGTRRGRQGGLPLQWAALAGLTLGLGLAAKLTAVLSLGAVAVWAAVVLLLALLPIRPMGFRQRLGRAWTAGRGWALALVVALGVFVLSNPHLYPDPLRHTGHLFDRRAQEMQVQRQQHPEAALDNPLDRLGYLLHGSLIRWTLTGANGVGLALLLAATGVALLLTRTWRGWHHTGWPPAEALVLLTVLIYAGGVSAGLALAYARYLLPSLLLGALLSGLGAAGLAAWVALTQARLRRQLLGTTWAASQTEPRTQPGLNR
jgi:hypothetical protein